MRDIDMHYKPCDSAIYEHEINTTTPSPSAYTAFVLGVLCALS